MARQFVVIGAGPSEEPLAQIDSDGYEIRARLECRAFIAELHARIGKPPRGGALTIRRNRLEAGSYYEVVAVYNDADPASMQWAADCEHAAIPHWTDAGMAVIHRDPTLDMDAMTSLIFETRGESEPATDLRHRLRRLETWKESREAE